MNWFLFTLTKALVGEFMWWCFWALFFQTLQKHLSHNKLITTTMNCIKKVLLFYTNVNNAIAITISC